MKRLCYLAIAAVMTILVSCSDSNSHRNIVPQTAKVVMRLDYKELYKQTGIDRDKLKASITELIDDEDIVVGIDAIGLDVDAPIYGFVDENVLACGSAGLVVKVCDRKQFEDFIEEKAKLKGDEVDGITVYVPNDGRELVVGVSDEAMLILGPSFEDTKKLKKQLVSMLKHEDADNDPSDNELFKRAEDADAILSLYGDLSVVPDAAWNFLRRSMAATGQEDVLDIEELNSMTYGIDITAADHILNVNFWCESSDKDVQKKIDDMNGNLRKVNDDAFGLFTDNTVFGCAIGLNGKNVAEYVKPHLANIRSQMGNMAPMIDIVLKLVKLIDGNVLFAFDDAKTMDGGLAIMTTGDGDALTEAFTSLGLPSPSKENGKLVFGFEGVPSSIVLDNKLFTVTMNDDAKSRINDSSTLNSDLQSQIKKHFFTLFLNVNASIEQAEKSGNINKNAQQIIDALQEITDNVHYVTITL